MSQHLMCDLAKAEGFCCEDTYLCEYSNVRASILAKRLGVDKRTINSQRARLRIGETRCNGTCRNAKTMFELYLVRAEKELKKDGTYYRVPTGSTLKNIIYRRAVDYWVEMYIEKAKELTGEKIGRLEALEAFRGMGVNGGNGAG